MAFVEVDDINIIENENKLEIKQELQSLIFSFNFPFRRFCASK
jgi:hypothetical protein